MNRDNLLHLAATLIIVGGLLAATPYLIPNDRDVGLIRLRDKEFDQAFKIFQARYERGERDITLMGALTKLYLQNGHVGEAIRLTEELLAERPEDPEVMRLLAVYYQYGQRNADYTHILEKLWQVSPREDELRSLSKIYNFEGRYQDQIKVLNDIITRGWGTEKDVQGLAYLHAANGQVQEALEVFESRGAVTTLATQNAGHKSWGSVELQLNLMVDAGKTEQAMSLAREWLRDMQGSGSFIDLVDTLESKGKPALALALLESKRREEPDDLALKVRYGTLLVASGRYAEAYEELDAVRSSAYMTQQAWEALTTAAVETQRLDEALALVRSRQRRLPSYVYFSGLEMALKLRQFQALPDFLERIPKPAQASRPVLMARTLYALDQHPEADAWVKRSLDATLTTYQRFSLAGFLVEIDSPEAAPFLLGLLDQNSVAEFDYPAFAELLVLAGLSEKAFAYFDGIRQRRGATPAVAIAWALSAVGEGRQDAVSAWLGDLSGTPEALRAQIDPLLDVAKSVSAWAMVQLLSERLLAIPPSRVSDHLDQFTALVALGQRQEAAREAVRIAALDMPDEQTRLSATAALLDADFGVEAEQLLSPVAARRHTDGIIGGLWARTQLQLGRSGVVFAELASHQQDGQLAGSMAGFLVEAAIAEQRWPFLQRLPAELLNSAPPWAVTALYRHALAVQDWDFVERLLVVLGDESLRFRPLLHAEYAYLQGDIRQAAATLAAVDTRTIPDSAEKVRIANLWLRIGEEGRARRALRSVDRFDTLDAFHILDFVRMSAQLGGEVEGIAKYLAAAQRHWSQRTAPAAMILAAKQGSEASARKFADSPRWSKEDAEILKASMYAAAELDRPQLALRIMKRLERLGVALDVRMQAEVYLAAGNLARALELTAPLDTTQKEERGLRIAALSQAYGKGLRGHRSELLQLLREALSQAEGEERRQIGLNLYAYGAYDEALPVLEEQLATDVDLVAPAYIDALLKLERHAEIVDLLTRNPLKDEIGGEDRRQAAYSLLAANDKAAAVEVFKGLAVKNGPKSQDMENLLFVVGSRPAEPHLEWFLKQTDLATGETRFQWVEVLQFLAATPRAVPLAEKWYRSERLGRWDYRSIVAVFGSEENPRRLREVFNRVLNDDQTQLDNKFYMRAALSHKMPRVAIDFGERAIADHRADADIYRLMGVVRYSQEDYDQAKRHLNTYLVHSPDGDFESHFYFAETLAREDDVFNAAVFYEKALNQIQQAKRKSFFMRHLAGLIFQRLERYDEAVEVLQSLVHESPNNDGVRADLAETYMLKRAPKRARDVLDSGRRS